MVTASGNPYRTQAPVIVDGSEPGRVEWRGDRLRLALEGSALSTEISRSDVFDLVPTTFADVETRVAPGTPLRDFLEAERERWRGAAGNGTAYGCYALMPGTFHVVRYPSRTLWDYVQCISSATLYRDFGLEGSFERMRERIAAEVPAVAGCSVGRRIVEGLFCYHFGAMKLADGKPPHPAGNNRAPSGYADITSRVSKATALARQLYEQDALAELSVYNAGITSDTITDFVAGNPEAEEPAATIVFGETDDLVTKILLRIACKQAHVSYAMITDLGRWSLVDYHDWSRYPDLPLVIGQEDERTLELLEGLREDPDNLFLRRRLVMSVVGGADMLKGELREILQGENQRRGDHAPLTDPPQDGSACLFGGVIAPRLVLARAAGRSIPARRLLDPLEGEVLRRDW